KEKYAIGDTIKLKGRAKAYSGMPVQGAEVSYTVNRNPVLWWWYSNENSETVFEGKAITDEKGEFDIELPFIFPDEKKSKKSANR
ncbi:pollen Ole e 1 allergen/extensin family protein, partial [Klebsiella pneumoniae]|nr:pollen Ole e 1 allergen/extensin family protein [Klebsiella pneumoniae]